MDRARPRLTVVLLVTGVVALARPAGAQPADPHAAAEALVRQVADDAAHRSATAEVLALARAALERASRLRVAGDEAHAMAADGLALEWAETARDVARAVDAEARAAELRRKAVEAQTQLERTRSLVETAVASVGRLTAQIAQAEGKGREGKPAIEAHDGQAAPTRKAPPGKGQGPAATPPRAAGKSP